MLTLAVDGMYCPVSPGAVDHPLESVKGVVDAKVSFDDNSAVVLYHSLQVSKEDIPSALRDPYSATIVSDAPA